MSMTRSEHYQRAQELLGRVTTDPDAWLQEERLEALAAAQLHATLALAMPDVSGEAVPGAVVMELGPVEYRAPVGLRAKLEAALAELERQGRKPATATEVASFIRQAVLGGSAREHVEGRYGKCGPDCEEGHTYRAGCALEPAKEEGR